MGSRCAGVVIVVLGVLAAAAAPAAAQQGGDAAMTDRITRLEAIVQRQQQRIKELEEKGDGTALAELIEKKLEQLRDELRGEMASLAGGGGPTDFRVYWSSGLRMESGDKSVKLKIGGRMMYDIALFCDEDLADGAEVRRARFYFAGSMGKHCAFKLQFDFAGGDADLKDAYIRLTNVPLVGNITLGHYDEPFGLEQCVSTKYITFMERALPIEAFSPCSNWGVKLNDTILDGRMTWAGGFFVDTDDYGTWTDSNRHAFTVRVTGLPVYEQEGRRLLHLGVSYSCRALEDGGIQFRSRAESHLAPRLVDTGTIAADSAQLFAGEVAFVIDSLTFQAEYMTALVDGAGGDLCFCGFYGQVSYLLTGERRPYGKSDGAFGRVKPLRPFCNGKGPGAWEIAGRYSYVDLNDGSIAGGRLRDITLGVNWYLNSNLRLMLNYVCAQVQRAGDDDSAHIVQMRMQVDF